MSHKLLLSSSGIIQTPAGRILYRHPSNLGTIIEFKILDVPKKTLVLDAKYRTTSPWGMYNQTSGLGLYPNKNINDTWNIDGGDTAIYTSLTLGDSELDTIWSTKIDANTSRQNCDVWMTFTDVTTTGDDGVAIVGVPGVQYARSISVDGISCDVPNINNLSRIFCEAEFFDLLDPTVDEYSDYRLGETNPNGRWMLGNCTNVWSSTTTGNYSNVTIFNGGQLTHKLKSRTYGIIPIVELI